MNEVKRLYSIITNPQSWRTSLATSPTPSSKQNATDCPADDSSTYEDCRSQVLSSDEASSQSSGAIYAAPASLTDRLRPEGEASAESCRSSEMYSDVDIDDAGSDTSETYKILDTSKHNSADVEKRYQNLVDMSEELQMMRATPEIKSNEYDVPRITFTFFDEKKLNDNDEIDNNYEILNIKPLIYARPVKQSKCKTELKITLSQANVANRIDSDQNVNSRATAETSLKKNKNSCANMSKSHDNLSSVASRRIKSQININLSKSTGDISNVNREQKTRSNSFDKLVTSTKTLQLTKTVTFMTTEKRTSRSLGDIIDDQSEEVVKYPLMSLENLPRSIEEKRNEAADNADVVQVLSGDEEEEDLEYCRARNKLPARIRRATLIKKTQVKSRAVDTWSTFRLRLSNLITTQAAAQRVGAQNNTTAAVHYDEYPKAIGKSVDKMYKKTKKLVLPKINGRIFVKRSISKDKENFQDTFSDDGVLYHRADCAGMKDNVSCDGGGSDVTITTAVNNCDGGDNQKRGVNECAISELDLTNVRTTPFRRSKQLPSEGQNGFDDLRRYIKQGGDFCKELSAVLQERSEAELQYAKSLSKLSNKLSRACREGVGGINDAWKSIAAEMETRADIHRQFSATLCEEIVKPLRQLTEAQHKTRKQSEGAVDKSARSLGEWRTAEAKSKKQSHASARENEKLQDTLLDVRLSRSTSLIHLSHLHGHKTVSDRETAKLEVKKRKAENAVKKADIEYYTLCVRSERARLEWESAVLRGAGSFQSLEEERLNNLKLYLASYLNISSEMTPRLIEITDGLRAPIAQSEPGKDLQTFLSLRSSSQHVPEQLLPDFYCEHITLAMNRERRKQALVKILQLIRQDLDRERKSKHGLENLSRAIKQTPNFGSEDSQQTVSEKLYHMRSMLTYLEGARYKVQSALAEIDNRQRIGHPLASHISITRDKSGLQQSILKVPPWLRDEAIKPLTAPTNENADNDDTDWSDRGMGDGNSNQPDSDFDEFSSQTSGGSESAGSSHTIATEEPPTTPLCHCKALYAYTANLGDEISLRPGDVLAVYRQQPDGWWLGECNGSVGIFPATYVEQID